MRLSPGTQLGRYEVIESIGAGGMGEVYRARDTKLRRDVAIKVLPEEFSQDRERLDRFEREARLLAQLNHANIATLHGLEEHDSQQFLVMELVEGETLAERIARGPLPIDEAIPLFIQIAEGLEAAHDKGIVHRDLKPANIKIGPDGKPKILDFGLAKDYGRKPLASNLAESPTLTRGTATGVILGTAPYMSPEQARGKGVDKRSDIWAFGCVLYEALTGRKPFDGDTVADVLGAIVKTEPDWDRLPDSTPLKIRELLHRCLRKDSRRRLRDIGDAWVDLEEAAAADDVAATLPRLQSGTPQLTWTAVVAIIIAVTAAGIALWALTRPRARDPRTVTRSVIPLAPGQALDLTGTASLAISPDGDLVAYVARSGSARELYLRAIDQLEGHPVDGTRGARMPFFSPDGQWIGFHANGKLLKASIRGGAPVTIVEIGNNHTGASWGSDGRIVYGAQNAIGLWRVSADGGAAEVLTLPDRERREHKHRFPEILPGGKAVLFTLASADITSMDDASIAVVSLETGEYHVVLEGGTHARYSSSGHLVYARAGALLAVPFDLDELQVTGAPVRVVEGVSMSPKEGNAEFVLTREGSLLYAPGDSRAAERRLIWVDRQGRSETLMEATGPFRLPQLSPDGRYLAVSKDEANNSLWILDIARTTMILFATGFIPIWTPDGQRVTWLGPEGLTWQAADGSGQAEVLLPFREERPTTVFARAADASMEAQPIAPVETNHVNWRIPLSWSPDGKVLAFEEMHPQTGGDIGLLKVGDETTVQAFLHTPANEADAVFSPDGEWLAYDTDESGRFEVYLQAFPSGRAKQQVSNAGGRAPLWNPSGGELFYRDGDQVMVVDVQTNGELVLSKPRILFEKLSVLGGYDVTRDGERFVMIERSEVDPPPTQLILVQNWAEELKRLVPTDN